MPRDREEGIEMSPSNEGTLMESPPLIGGNESKEGIDVFSSSEGGNEISEKFPLRSETFRSDEGGKETSEKLPSLTPEVLMSKEGGKVTLPSKPEILLPNEGGMARLPSNEGISRTLPPPSAGLGEVCALLSFLTLLLGLDPTPDPTS